jgi:hypothetical protein
MTEAAPENTPAAPESPQASASQAPPWGSEEEFNPEKAWNLIQGLRADKEKLASRPVLDEVAQQKLSEYERLEQASKTELERATEELSRWQSEAEKWRTASVSSRIEALASQDFADPSDAAAALSDPSKYLDAGGQINDEAIRADLNSVLERKPHWRRSEQPAGPRLPQPSPHQGSGANGRPAADPANEFAAIIQGQLGP